MVIVIVLIVVAVVIDELVCATGNGIAIVVVVVVIVLIVVAVEVVVIVSTTRMELRSVDRLARFLSLPLQVELRLNARPAGPLRHVPHWISNQWHLW